MTKQFFLIKLSDDRSKYKDQDWESLIKHIKNHNSNDVAWSTNRPVSNNDSISIFCDSFKSTLNAGQARERIQGEKT